MVVIASRRLRVRQKANEFDAAARLCHARTIAMRMDAAVNKNVAGGDQRGPSGVVRTSVISSRASGHHPVGFQDVPWVQDWIQPGLTRGVRRRAKASA